MPAYVFDEMENPAKNKQKMLQAGIVGRELYKSLSNLHLF